MFIAHKRSYDKNKRCSDLIPSFTPSGFFFIEFWKALKATFSPPLSPMFSPSVCLPLTFLPEGVFTPLKNSSSTFVRLSKFVLSAAVHQLCWFPYLSNWQ